MDDWGDSPVKRSYSHYDDDRDLRDHRDDRDDRSDREGRSRHKRRRSSDYDLPPPPSPPEIEYRILCPISKIGAVIGKGGSIIKSLRQETRAKIKVEDVIHGADERVIYISSPLGGPLSPDRRDSRDRDSRDRDSRDRDSRDSRDSRDDRDDFRKDRSREEMLCAAQEALFQIHMRITERSDSGGDTPERRDGGDDDDADDRAPPHQVSARLLVSDAQVGCLLGKGGRIIEQMRKDIAAQIRILPKSNLPPCAFPNDDLVQLSGTPDLVRKALYAVSCKLYDNPVRDRAHRPSGYSQGGSLAGGGMYSSMHGSSNVMGMGHYSRSGSGNSYSSRSGRSDGPSEEELMVCILCPNERIGSMIGKGGSIIRKLREDSGAKIRVCDQVSGSDERVIQISAIEHVDSYASPVVEAAMQVFRRLADISAEKEGRNAILSIRLLVRSSQIGCLLGKGGQIITDMRKMSRANIRIPPKEELPACADDGSELVQLSGETPMVEAALVQVLNRLRSNLFKGRDVNAGMLSMSYQGSSMVPSYGGGRDEPGSPGGYSYEYGNYSPSSRSSKESRRRRR